MKHASGSIFIAIVLSQTVFVSLAYERDLTSVARAPTASAERAIDFNVVERKEFLEFLTGSYRNVSAEFAKAPFEGALLRHNIVIFDHENTKRGSTETGHATFIYSAEQSRLVQTRAERSKK